MRLQNAFFCCSEPSELQGTGEELLHPPKVLFRGKGGKVGYEQRRQKSCCKRGSGAAHSHRLSPAQSTAKHHGPVSPHRHLEGPPHSPKVSAGDGSPWGPASLEKAICATWVPTMCEHLRVTPKLTNQPNSVPEGGPSLAKAAANVQAPQAEPEPQREREEGEQPGGGHAQRGGLQLRALATPRSEWPRARDGPEGTSEME